MKIALINPLMPQCLREQELETKWPPLGLLYLASSLESAGHTVSLLERKLLWWKAGKDLVETDRIMMKNILKFNPDLIGISATTPLYLDARYTARLIRERFPETKIAIGGVHPTLLPVETLKESPEIDVVVIGEGEDNIVKLADNIPLNKILGIAYRENSEIRLTAVEDLSSSLDTLPFPARHLLDKKFYFAPSSTIARGYYEVATTIITSRGCPYRCSFCSSEALAKIGRKKRIRYHSPAYIVAEIEQLIKDYGITGLVFADDMFLLDKNRVAETCDLLIRKGFHKSLKWTANVRADAVDEDILKSIKKAGCAHLVIGFESGSQRMLERMRKNVKVETYYRAAELIHKAKLPFEVNIIHGLPDETEKDFRDTIKLLKKTKPSRIFCTKLYPMPGSAFYRELINQGKMVVSSFNDILEKYFLGEVTFANMSYNKYRHLCNIELGQIILPTNYKYAIRNNFASPFKLLKYTLLFILHPILYFLPGSLRRLFLNMARFVKVKST